MSRHFQTFMKLMRNLYLFSADCKIKTTFWITKKMLQLRKFKTNTAKNNLPLWIRLAIELQSDCNRDCFFCPRSGDNSGVRKDINGKHTKKIMPIWKVLDIIDQAERLGYKGGIGFHRLSEPFLDKRYIEIAAYAKKKGMIVEDDTNGDILKKDPALCSEIDGLVDNLRIGLYDYQNIKEKKEQMRFWRTRFNKTKISFSLAAEFPGVRKNSNLYLNRKRMDYSKMSNYPCILPMIGLWIRYDGNVSLCCDDDDCSFGLGNVFDSSIEDIWWSKKHIEIINTLQAAGGRHKYPGCRDCTFIGFFSYWTPLR